MPGTPSSGALAGAGAANTTASATTSPVPADSRHRVPSGSTAVTRDPVRTASPSAPCSAPARRPMPPAGARNTGRPVSTARVRSVAAARIRLGSPGSRSRAAASWAALTASDSRSQSPA